MQIIGVSEAAKRLKVNPARVRALCAEGRVNGANLLLGRWHIPLPIVVYAVAQTSHRKPKIRMHKIKHVSA